VTPEMVGETVPCGPDLDGHHEAIRRFATPVSTSSTRSRSAAPRGVLPRLPEGGAAPFSAASLRAPAEEWERDALDAPPPGIASPEPWAQSPRICGAAGVPGSPEQNCGDPAGPVSF
jgi:hypothetical protein